VTDEAEVAPEIVTALRAVCLALPDAYEEQAWVGTRWCIRKKTFVHVVKIDGGWPPAYARATGSDGPITVVTFRTPHPEIYHGGQARHPFFWPGWFPNLFGLVLDDHVAWDEIGEFAVESYCVVAPKKLVALVDRPGD
jgi:hypothetical protein